MRLKISSAAFQGVVERVGTEDQIWDLIDFAMDIECMSLFDGDREEIPDAKKQSKREIEADGFTEFGNVRFQIWKE